MSTVCFSVAPVLVPPSPPSSLPPSSLIPPDFTAGVSSSKSRIPEWSRLSFYASQLEVSTYGCAQLLRCLSLSLPTLSPHPFSMSLCLCLSVSLSLSVLPSLSPLSLPSLSPSLSPSPSLSIPCFVFHFSILSYHEHNPFWVVLETFVFYSASPFFIYIYCLPNSSLSIYIPQ